MKIKIHRVAIESRPRLKTLIDLAGHAPIQLTVDGVPVAYVLDENIGEMACNLQSCFENREPPFLQSSLDEFMKTLTIDDLWEKIDD